MSRKWNRRIRPEVRPARKRASLLSEVILCQLFETVGL
jgi:hypothetical protein